MRKVNRVLHNVPFVGKTGISVDGSVGHEKLPRIERRVDDKYVAHPAVGPQLLLSQDGHHEFICMQAALHQRFHPAVAGEDGRLYSGRMAVLSRNEFVRGQIELGLLGRRPYLRLGPDHHGQNQARSRRFDGTAERQGINWMDDGCAEGLQALRLLNDPLIVTALCFGADRRASLLDCDGSAVHRVHLT